VLAEEKLNEITGRLEQYSIKSHRHHVEEMRV
jgi:hypothetical protein